MSVDPIFGGLAALGGLSAAAAAAPTPPESTAPAAPPASLVPPAPVEAGSAAVPFRGGKFEFGGTASVALGMLGIRGDAREQLRRAVEIDARLERVLTRRPPSLAAQLQRAAKAQRRAKR